MDFTEKCLQQQYLYRGRILNLRRDQVSLPDGSLAHREVVEHSGGVAVAALTDQQELLLVKQYRYPYGKELLELPAGKLETGEDPALCGRRELLEETGVTAGEFAFLSQLYPTPAYCSEVIHLYLARCLSFGDQRLDQGEFLSVHKIPVEQAVGMVFSGEIKDAKTQIGILKVQYLLQCQFNGK